MGKYDNIAADFSEEDHIGNKASQFHGPIKGRETVKLTVSGVGEILNSPLPEFLIYPFLYMDTVNLLTSCAGAGKSILSLSIAHAVVTGLPLWGRFPVRRTGTVLIIDEENPAPFLKDRLVKMGFKEGMPLYFLHYQSVKLDNPGCFASLLSVIEEIKPVFVIFDALIRFHNANENDNSEMSGVMAKTRELARSGTTVLIIHHERKGHGGRLERARGSGDIVGAIDTQVCLESDDGGLVLLPGKTRMAPFKPIRLKLDSASLAFTYEGFASDPADDIVNDIIGILGDKRLSFHELRDALDGRGIAPGENRLRSLLKKAAADGKLAAFRGARGKLTYEVPAK